MINKDELTDNARTFAQKLSMWFRAFTGFYVALMPWSLVLTLALVGGIFIAWLTYQSTSKNEQRAEDARTETVVTDAESNVAEGQVERSRESVAEAEKASQKARKERERAKETNTTNTSYATANAERCKTFPESKECR